MNLARALRLVHTSPTSLTRADLARELGCVRATAAALVADLQRLSLAQEQTVAVTGRRGRPSAVLGAAPDGPVVVALEIAPGAVRVAHVPVTGGLCDPESLPLASQDLASVLDGARDLLAARLVSLGTRVAGVGVAMHGLVDRLNATVVSAPGFTGGTGRVDVLAHLGLSGPGRQRVQMGNVATLIALAEAVRGCARGDGTVLVLHAAVGLGGALLVEGKPVIGRRGLAGEYGHAPFGVENLPCRCGAHGCWETEVDRVALAREAGSPGVLVQDVAALARHVLDQARSQNPDALEAVHRSARSLGRGVGALVAIHDPDLVVVTEHAADLFVAAPSVVADALAGADAPPLVVGALGDEAALVGAAESVFDVLLDDLPLLTSTWERP